MRKLHAETAQWNGCPVVAIPAFEITLSAEVASDLRARLRIGQGVGSPMSAVPANILDAFLDVLAERVAAKIAEKTAGPSTHYGSGRSATLPPGKSRAWAVRNLKSIPGARKVGRDWVVSVDDYEAWLADRDAARFRQGIGETARAANDTVDVEALADQALAEAGLRRTRGAATR